MKLYSAEERDALVKFFGPHMVTVSETLGIRVSDQYISAATYKPVLPPRSQRVPRAKVKRPKQRKDPNCRNQRKRRRP